MKVSFIGNKPRYMTSGAAGADLMSNFDFSIQPGEQVFIDTGTAIALPEDMVAILAPRSSLCNKHGLVLANSIGIIDSDYRGNIKCCYRNTSDEVVNISKGERVCQLLILNFQKAEFDEVDALPDTERGDGGFGSTGEK